MWRNVMFSDEFRFCLWRLDQRVNVWRRCGECCADCYTDGGGGAMVWDGISLTGKTRLVITGGNLSAEGHRGEILQPVALPYLHSLRLNSILQDDNARPPQSGFIRDYLHNLGVKRMERSAFSPDLNPTEHLWDQLGCAVCTTVTNTTTLADL
uniref:Tc1-like transposase DDE domain-containing protein n=1 Tax=Amphilophus citrinellus TaxID=61819 RepID=A0A3Q0T115_AMPCI